MQPHANGDGASKKRKRKKDDEPEQGGEPFLGPIPPDPKTGAPRSHVSGSSLIRDERTGKEYANTWDIEDRGSELHTKVGGHTGRDKFGVTSKSRDVINHYREVQRQAERAAYAGRPAVPVPKPSAKKSKPKAGAKKSCSECEGTGLVWFGDYADMCPNCNGTGEV